MPTVHPEADAFASDYGHGLTKREYIATHCLAAMAGSGNHHGLRMPLNAPCSSPTLCWACWPSEWARNSPRSRVDPDDELIDLAAAGEIIEDDGQPD